MQASCTSDSTGCIISHGIVRWLAFMIQVTVLGFTFIFFSSLGGSKEVGNRCYTFFLLWVGVFAVVISTVVPYFVVSQIKCTLKAKLLPIR